MRFLLDGPGQRLGQIALKFFSPLADDEILGPVRRTLQPRHRQNLRHDDLVHHRRQIAVALINPGDMFRQKLEFHRHVQADLETVAGRKLDELVQAQHVAGIRWQHRFRARPAQLTPPAWLAAHSADVAFQPDFISGGFLHPLLRHIIHPLFHLLRQRPLLQALHRHVLRDDLRLGHHLAARLAQQRHLIDANFQQIDLQFLGIHVVQPRLQDILPHTLFARTRRRRRAWFASRTSWSLRRRNPPEC
jgi:hypothetical protein